SFARGVTPGVGGVGKSSSRIRCRREANPMTSTAFTWADFYLICFAVGFCFGFFSFVFGSSRMGKLHLPHFHSHAGDLPGAHGPVAHGPAAADGSGGGHGGAHSHAQASVSAFNPPSVAAFLAWFGGTGYLLTRFSAIWVGSTLFLAVLAGLVGGTIIFF